MSNANSLPTTGVVHSDPATFCPGDLAGCLADASDGYHLVVCCTQSKPHITFFDTDNCISGAAVDQWIELVDW